MISTHTVSPEPFGSPFVPSTVRPELVEGQTVCLGNRLFIFDTFVETGKICRKYLNALILNQKSAADRSLLSTPMSRELLLSKRLEPLS
jgi:hypothetical protein